MDELPGVYVDIFSPSEPVRVRAKNKEGQKFSGLIVPLVDVGKTK